MSENVPGLPGVTVERDALGALGVWREGVRLGWLHEHGGTWAAYVPRDGVTGQLLGRFSKDAAVRAVADAAESPPGPRHRNERRDEG